jgi:hypothetical protein
MKAYWDARAMPGYFEAFLEGLCENDPKVLPSGNAGVIDAVARGEADLGLTDTDDAIAAQARGLKLAFVLPRHARDAAVAGGGTYAIPNTVAIVKGCPHPDAARRFVEFMCAVATERQLAEMPEHHAPLVSPVKAGDLVIPDPLDVDPKAVAAAADEAVNAFFAAQRAVVEQQAQPRPRAGEDSPADGEKP